MCYSLSIGSVVHFISITVIHHLKSRDFIVLLTTLDCDSFHPRTHNMIVNQYNEVTDIYVSDTKV